MTVTPTPLVTLRPRTTDIWIVRKILFALLLAASVAVVHAAEGVRNVPLVRDDAVLVSFELTDGYTPAAKDAVHSGLKTTFTYEIEFRQGVPPWGDRTIAGAGITNTAPYGRLP